MPHLKYWNRYWRVAGDEFALPALCSISGRLSWTALISVIIALSYDSLANCKYGWVLISYLLCSVILFVLSIVCDMLIMAVSLHGSVVETEKRHSLGKFLSIRIALGLLQLLCAIFGIITLNYQSNVPCNAQFESSSLNRIFVSIVVISQMIDVSALCCCCYLFSANRIDDDMQPRDESWALNTWESRCRKVTKSIQMCSCNLFGGANITEGFEDVAKMLTHLFHHDGFLDVVPSDVAAGIVLVRLEQRTRRQLLSGQRSCRLHHSSQASCDGGGLSVASPAQQTFVEVGDVSFSSEDDSPMASDHHSILTNHRQRSSGGAGSSAYAHPSIALITSNVHDLSCTGPETLDLSALELMTRCCLYALAIYTHLMLVYMRPCSALCRMSCGTRNRQSTTCCCSQPFVSHGEMRKSPVVEGDNSCGLHLAGMSALSAELADSELLYASFRNDTSCKPYAVFLDHEKQLVVVVCRGTLSLEDCVTDALCEPVEVCCDMNDLVSRLTSSLSAACCGGGVGLRRAGSVGAFRHAEGCIDDSR